MVGKYELFKKWEQVKDLRNCYLIHVCFNKNKKNVSSHGLYYVAYDMESVKSFCENLIKSDLVYLVVLDRF